MVSHQQTPLERKRNLHPKEQGISCSIIVILFLGGSSKCCEVSGCLDSFSLREIGIWHFQAKFLGSHGLKNLIFWWKFTVNAIPEVDFLGAPSPSCARTPNFSQSWATWESSKASLAYAASVHQWVITPKSKGLESCPALLQTSRFWPLGHEQKKIAAKKTCSQIMTIMPYFRWVDTFCFIQPT